MYCVIDDLNHVIAFHDDFDVVEKYTDMIHKFHKKSFTVAELTKKRAKKIKDLDELYLVRYGDSYVQSGYLQYAQILSDTVNYDNKHCKEVLLRILETSDLDDKESKCISKAIIIVDRIMKDDLEYTPLLNTLEMEKLNYDAYKYNKGMD